MSKKQSGFSRRDFLRTAGAATAGSMLSVKETIGKISGTSGSELALVPTRPFGKTGAQVSILGLGGMFDIPSNQLVLRQALKWGVTYWDTADCYEGGRSERGIGSFLAKYPEARNKVFLVSKSDSRDPSGMTRLLDRSLERMKTDYIDLYFVHGISGIDELNKSIKAWAQKAKAEGKIKFFGFSSHSNMEECMLEAAKLGWIEGIMMTYNYRIMQKTEMKEAVAACKEAGIGLTARKTQGGWSFGSSSAAKLVDTFIAKGFTDAQAKLKAVWTNPNIASICSQMPNITILMSNVAAAMDKTKLSAGDWRLLDQYARETASNYCAGCSNICETALGGAIPVAKVMRYLMYYDSYGDRHRARSLYGQLSSQVRARIGSFDYSLAERRCPQGMAIGRLMKRAEQLLV
ncbi:MAG: aldo/keto reductase [Deltaproteobacteria bacterium]|nr:MAG: aldo/keto reductase [Deltaproteobacteria bacterium]